MRRQCLWIPLARDGDLHGRLGPVPAGHRGRLIRSLLRAAIGGGTDRDARLIDGFRTLPTRRSGPGRVQVRLGTEDRDLRRYFLSVPVGKRGFEAVRLLIALRDGSRSEPYGWRARPPVLDLEAVAAVRPRRRPAQGSQPGRVSRRAVLPR